MKKLKIGLVLVCVSVFFLGSCKHQTNTIISKTEVTLDSLNLKCYADTIVCDMVVKNPLKDDKLTEEWLGRLMREALIENIFEDIYKGNLIASEYSTNRKLSVDEVKAMEKTPGYSRDIIGKFQFCEGWFYDRVHHTFIKKVYSIIFGYEVYNESNEVRGYKPLFKVEF